MSQNRDLGGEREKTPAEEKRHTDRLRKSVRVRKTEEKLGRRRKGW